MGIDFLEIAWTAEKRFGAKVDVTKLQASLPPRKQRDITVEELFRHLGEQAAPRCRSCGLLLEKPPPNLCPKCFSRDVCEPVTWDALRDILIKQLVLDYEEVQPGAFLMRDLGCT